LKRSTRRIVFRLVAVAIGLMPFVLLELGLRLAGVAADPVNPAQSQPLSAIDHDPLVDLHSLRPLFVRSEDGSMMNIGEERMNYFCPASFSIAKPSNTIRIFALGGSTTQGQPYLPETAFPKWLELRLQAALPERKIEVINAGGISYASYRVAAILDEVLRYSPDLVVLYTGHNEFLEARTYARQRSIPRWMAGPLAMVSRLRVARVAGRMFADEQVASGSKTALPGEVDTMLDHADGMDAYQRDEDWTEGVHRHFETTLARMIDRCQDESVPMVLCVPAGDIVNTPPFKSVPAEGLTASQNDSLTAWAKTIQSDAEFDLRMKAAEDILKLDPQNALANYALGRWKYEAAEDDPADAIKYLTMSRDHDVCSLRATTRIENEVRSYRDAENVYLVDTPRLLDRRDATLAAKPDGIADPSWFVDHVHPSIEGHQVIAEGIFDRLLDRGWIEPKTKSDASYAVAVENHLKTLGEAYFGRAKQRLEGVNRWSRRNQ